MHTVYHLPDFVWPDGRIGKIGCTAKYPKRCLDQGHTNYEALFTHEDGWIAGDKELELQAEYGYRVDTCHYMISLQNSGFGNSEISKVGGRLGGLATAASGKLLESSKKGSRKQRKLSFEQAEEIRTKFTTGNYTQAQLQKEYNASRHSIFRIVHNKTYLEP